MYPGSGPWGFERFSFHPNFSGYLVNVLDFRSTFYAIGFIWQIKRTDYSGSMSMN